MNKRNFWGALLFTALTAFTLSLPCLSASDDLISVTYTEITPPKKTENEINTSENLPAPVILSFEDSKAFSTVGRFAQFADGLNGKYEFVTAPDGTRCLQLIYSANDTFAGYRMMPAFLKAGTVSEAHKYVRITYMTDNPSAAAIQLINNADMSDVAVLTADTSQSAGKWVRSNAANIGYGKIAARFSAANHCTLEYTCNVTDSTLYIKELAFFASEAQAYEYYGDELQRDGITYSAMTFGNNGTGKVNTTMANFGNSIIDPKAEAVTIKYAESTNFLGAKYMAKLYFANRHLVQPGQNYVRLIYAAENP